MNDTNESGVKPFAHVVHVLDTRRVVIDRGAKDVDVGDRFVVYALSDDVIADPKTGKDLGQLEVFKGTGEVIHVQETMATIQSDRIPGRRIIRQNPDWIFKNPFRQGVEEVRDEPALPFESPAVGDCVRRI